MKRRAFLAALGSAAVPLTWPRRARGQPVTRAAIVIGVDRCKDLPKLKAAASGAHQFAQWLRGEGFVVKEFLDHKSPVTASPIYDTMEELVDAGTLEQLVIYFSGHGFLVSTSEHWMLSKGPANPNESIIQSECVFFARRLGIPHVVFISDACRSTTSSLGAQAMKGQVIFPSVNQVGPGVVRIDQFYATGAGDPALELPVDKSAAIYEGIYTSAFLSAFKTPNKSMVYVNNGVAVVPNAMLEDYLIQQTQRLAQAHSINLAQTPDARIESRVPAYLGRAQVPEPTHLRGMLGRAHNAIALLPDAPRPVVTLSDVAASSLLSAGLQYVALNEKISSGAVARLASDSGFATTRATVLMAVSPTANVPRSFETRTGIVVSGTRISRVKIDRFGGTMNLLERGDGTSQPAIIRLGSRPTSVAIRFEDESGTVVAAIPNFIATVVVKEGRVLDVSYLPSEHGPFSYDRQTMQRVSELRSAVAASAHFDVFRIQGDPQQREKQAEELADRIRVLKGIDPTLGIYAAYAYADIGLTERVRSVRNSMRAERAIDLFDVAMLDAALTGTWNGGLPVYPVCPMLTQGWSLLRASGTRLLNHLDDARGSLKQSLWTTLDARGMNILEELVARGEMP